MQQEGGKAGSFADCSEQVIGACIEVHRHLGPGLLESAYEQCLAYELPRLGLRFQRQRPIAITYKELRLPQAYRLDFVIEDEVILELKAIEQLLPVHGAQLLTYLKATGLRTGLLVNFGAATIRHGLRRLTNKENFPPSRLPAVRAR
jgi:GxxExxY protein